MSSNIKQTNTEKTWFEHRATEKLNLGKWYNEDIIVEVGEVIEVTNRPDRLKEYQYGLDGGRAYEIYPADKVKVFKVTKQIVQTTETTITEEAA